MRTAPSFIRLNRYNPPTALPTQFQISFHVHSRNSPYPVQRSSSQGKKKKKKLRVRVKGVLRIFFYCACVWCFFLFCGLLGILFLQLDDLEACVVAMIKKFEGKHMEMLWLIIKICFTIAMLRYVDVDVDVDLPPTPHYVFCSQTIWSCCSHN